ncbi:MAG: dihydropteroate synthase [Gemmatimonadaceae bacterium]
MPPSLVIPRPVTTWRIAGRVLVIDRPIVVGVLNVTPDSFSDGGRFASLEAAVARAEAMVAEGADVIDVGGESTRPQGARPVGVEEELGRVLPVVRELRRVLPEETPISVDTVKAAVAAAALEEGAQIVNDVSGFRLDRRMPEVCATKGAGVVLMHSRGGVTEMATYAVAVYEDVVDEVLNELRARVDAAQEAGVADECIVVDPGIGFSKRSEHSLAMLAALPRLAAWGYPVLVGTSRKRFVGELTGVTEPAQRVHGTTGANVAALQRGARLFRVHDVRAARHALDVAWAVMQAEAGA